MRDYKFDLKPYQGIKGEIVLTVPPYTARLRMIKDCNFSIDSKGEVSVGNDTLESIVKMIEATKKYIKSIDIKVKEEEVKSFDDMEYCAGCETLMIDIASSILNAGSLGKKK